jgi:phospholipid-binding lipoprotein MlaA
MSLAGLIFAVALQASPGAAAVAPAPPQAIAQATPGDPFEGFNRKVFAVNQRLDAVLFRPIAVAYRRWLPRPVRNAVHNALTNWDEPSVALNDLAQRRVSDAGKAALRFALNSTIGLLGAVDVAEKAGVAHHENGFTLTLGRYGVGSGPYLFLPIAGPSSARNLVGAGVDLVTNPLIYVRHIRSKTVEKVQTAASLLDTRARLDEDLQEIAIGSTDTYATERSIYLQHVQAQINGDEISLSDSPEIPGAPEMPTGKRAEPAPPPAEPAPPPKDEAAP